MSKWTASADPKALYHFLRRYRGLSEGLQDVVFEMLQIAADQNATQDEKQAAIDTVIEAFNEGWHDGPDYEFSVDGDEPITAEWLREQGFGKVCEWDDDDQRMSFETSSFALSVEVDLRSNELAIGPYQLRFQRPNRGDVRRLLSALRRV